MNAKDFRSTACLARAAKHGFDPYVDAWTLDPAGENASDAMWRRILREKLESLRRANWLAPWPCLVGLDDNVRHPAKLIKSRYGMCWAYVGEDDLFTGKFVGELLPEPIDPETMWEPTLLHPDKPSESDGVIVDEYLHTYKVWERHRHEWEQKHQVRRVTEMAPTYARVCGEGGRRWLHVYRTDGK